ncbi:MAG: AbrB/MazE/SpoVT family DNA-binding domain-containing protein [Candidatus Jordarchaeum sp.]|uniref:AbrB/MazE/SpoVT family DNA-binding domain-containing protein n=1 Tax=Candidatus Jordarchaeum sp. TaxID=2823881 RepID=UPI00404B49AB
MSFYKYRVKVLSGYRVSIPQEVRSRFNVKIGDELDLEVKGGRLIISFTKESPLMMLASIAEEAPSDAGGDELFLNELKNKLGG